MKVLFVHDVAHCSQDIIPHLNHMGVETEIIECRSLFEYAVKIRKSKADLFHANYVGSTTLACLLSGKNYVAHAHGDDVRHGMPWWTTVSVNQAKLRLYSTADLNGTMDDSYFLPRPVDTDRFFPREKPVGKNAVYFMQTTSHNFLRQNEYDYIKKIQHLSISWGYDLTIVPTMTSIAYDEMPKFLARFSLLFDKEFPRTELSKLALEAMAMKIQVYKEGVNPSIEENYEYVLRNHSSEIVAKRLLSLYASR